MDSLLTAFVLYFTSFFTLINPVGSMPVFLTMTASLSPGARRRTAVKAVITALITLMLFALGGQLLFDFFGISVHGFRIVGGIIFFMMGYEMLQARLSRIKITQEEVREYVDDISVTPLAIPMIAGPGAITNSIVLMEDAVDIKHKLVLLFSVVVTLALTLVFYITGASVTRFLGETGKKIMLKLMGLIVMVIAVEFFIAGLKPVIQDIFMLN